MKKWSYWNQWFVVVVVVMAMVHYADLASLPPGVGRFFAYLGAMLLPVSFFLLRDAYRAENKRVRVKIEWNRWTSGEDGRQIDVESKIPPDWPKLIPQPFPVDRDEQWRVFLHSAMWLHTVMGTDRKGIIECLKKHNREHCSPPLTDENLQRITEYAIREARSESGLPFPNQDVWGQPLLLVLFGPAMVFMACVILSLVIQLLGIVSGIEALRNFRFV
jgi:hypothetical protein